MTAIAEPPSGRCTAETTLPPTAAAPRIARRLTEYTCRSRRVPAAVVDNATFVIGELVANSVLQAAGPVRVSVVADTDQVRLRVIDHASVPPARAGRTGEARRWDVVRRLASTYGYRCDDAGREMWAVLRTARA